MNNGTTVEDLFSIAIQPRERKSLASLIKWGTKCRLNLQKLAD
jgi:hypothetical protein